MQSASSKVFWYSLIALGILIRLAVLFRCLTSRQRVRYLFFCLALTYVASGSVASLFAHDFYTNVWNRTRVPEQTLNALVAIEAFWGLARHFRDIRGFGWALLTIILAVSAGTAGILGILRATWPSPFQWGFLLGQFGNLALFLTALLSRAFFQQFRQIPVRPNAVIHLRVLGLLYGFVGFGFFIGQITKAQWPTLSALPLVAGPQVAYIWWLIAMRRAGEELPFASPVMSAEEYDASKSANEKRADQIKQAGSEALDKTLGSSRKPKRDWRFWRHR
jgi:hypothetical protein